MSKTWPKIRNPRPQVIYMCQTSNEAENVFAGKEIGILPRMELGNAADYWLQLKSGEKKNALSIYYCCRFISLMVVIASFIICCYIYYTISQSDDLDNEPIFFIKVVIVVLGLILMSMLLKSLYDKCRRYFSQYRELNLGRILSSQISWTT